MLCLTKSKNVRYLVSVKARDSEHKLKVIGIGVLDFKPLGGGTGKLSDTGNQAMSTSTERGPGIRRSHTESLNSGGRLPNSGNDVNDFDAVVHPIGKGFMLRF